MIKIIIFFIFSLIMLKISRPGAEIQDDLQPSSDIADSPTPEQNKENDSGGHTNLSIFQRFMILLRPLLPLAMELRDTLISEIHGLKFYRFFALADSFRIICSGRLRNRSFAFVRKASTKR